MKGSRWVSALCLTSGLVSQVPHPFISSRSFLLTPGPENNSINPEVPVYGREGRKQVENRRQELPSI